MKRNDKILHYEGLK
ncbi:hypothetical protein [Escherichia coli]